MADAVCTEPAAEALTGDAFRQQLRAWLAAHMTPEVSAKHRVTDETIEGLREWNRTLADAGWAAPTWPAEFGGRDAGIDEQIAYFEEMDAADAPGPINVIGVSNIAPAIMAFGTSEQQNAHLRPMLRGDVIWSQGMSEPDSGSDLASLRCRAERDGDSYVVNGQKTWNSLGHYADMCQLYVRTDPVAPKHKGITCLLVDLRTPGIEVRPVKDMSGGTAFAELFFTDARVPVSSILGPEHQGWRVAMTTLSHERAGVARLHLSLARKLSDLLAEPAVIHALRGPVARQQIARMYSQIMCMRWTTDRSLALLRQGQPSGSAGSLAKLAWSRADQELAVTAVDLLGLASQDGRWAANLAGTRSTSIAGGTTEINRNIVAEQGLGLPR